MDVLIGADRELKAGGLCAGEGFWILERIQKDLIERVYTAGSFESRVRGLGIPPDRIQVCTKHEMSRIAGFDFHRGVITLTRRPPVQDLAASDFTSGRYLVLADIADPDNAGSLVRSAAAFGLDGVAVTPGSADLYSRKAIRTSMAQVFRLKVFSIEGPEAAKRLRHHGIPLVAAAVGPGCISLEQAVSSLPSRSSWVLALGNEGRGLSKDWLDAADVRVTVPMADGVDSLNVGVAGGILLYELSRIPAL